jgi:alanine dehydrogenase
MKEIIMLIGCPKEIKPQEYRVGLTPNAVKEIILNGHKVLIEKDAGAGSGFSDQLYEEAGAKILQSAKEIFSHSEMVVKVKEPQRIERKMLKESQLLFTYLHLAPDPDQTHDLLESKCTAIAYETVTDDQGGLPLLAPMSEVAGRLAPQVGAWTLQKANGGRGILLGGVPGVEPARVTIIGGGVVGTNAAKVALGMGADVTVLERSITRMRQLDDIFHGNVKTIFASAGSTAEQLITSDLLIGAVLVPGATAPMLVSRSQLSSMKPGAAIVDVAIDQGGCFETSKATTHEDPIYDVDGIIHYCVANMPGAVARTSTIALGNATMPFILSLANKGWRNACKENDHLLNGLNVHLGNITYKAVAEALDLKFISPESALSM